MVKVTTVLWYMFLLVCAVGFAPPGKKRHVNWKQPSEAAAMMQQEARPIIVDVYTSWCYYCKVMDANTWSNDSVVSYVQQHFYPIKLNAEDRNSLSWMGKKYEYKAAYKVNTLAIELLKGNMVYPSTVIIPPGGGDWEVLPGAFKPAELEVVLRYFGERANEKMDFDTYRRQFHGKWR